MGGFHTILDRAWWAILLVFAGAAAVLGPHVPDLKVDAGTAAFLNESDPDLAYYESTRPDWGYDESAIVCVTRATSWIDAEGVTTLKAVVQDLAAARHVKSVTSVLGLPLLRQKPGSRLNLLQITTLDSKTVNYDAAREELLQHNLATAGLISKDGKDLALLVLLDVPDDTKRLDAEESKWKGVLHDDPGARAALDRIRPDVEASNERLNVLRREMVEDIRRVAKTWTDRLGFPVRLSGTPVISVNLKEHISHDLHTFVIWSAVLFVLAFLLIYRRTRFVVLPIVACALPPLLVVGTMAWGGKGVTLNTANLPLLLFVLMLPYTVYFIEAYRERRAVFPREPHGTSVFEGTRSIWLPCFYSCITTMAGFASLLTSDTPPVKTFGLMMTIGMGVGLLAVFTALPAMNQPLRAMAVASAGTARGARGVVLKLAQVSLSRPLLVVLASLVVLGVAAWGATKVTAESKFTEYFLEKSEVYQGLEYIDTRRGGTTPLEVILEAPGKEKDKNFFLTPRGLEAIASVERFFDGVPETGSIRSIKSLVDEIGKRDPVLAKDPVGLSRLATLGPAQAILSEMGNKDLWKARVLVRMKETAPTLNRNKIIAGLRAHLAAQPELKGLEVHPTGIFLLFANMLNGLLESQKDTFVMVLVAIYLMLLALFRSPILSILVLLPQVLPATVMLGVMGWFHIPLDLVTVVIASIAMGVGIDAAIQYTIRFRIELAVDGDPRAALLRSHATIGRAIWIATSIIVVGFGVLALSDFRPTIWFGLFTAIAMLMSQFAALTTLPSIFLLTGYPRVPKRP